MAGGKLLGSVVRFVYSLAILHPLPNGSAVARPVKSGRLGLVVLAIHMSNNDLG